MFVFQHSGPVRHACILRADDDRLVVAHPAAWEVAFLALIRAGLRQSSVKFASRGKALGYCRAREDGVRPEQRGEGFQSDCGTFRCLFF